MKGVLVVTGQGVSGSGVSSKVEAWIDLSRERFEPVLLFTSEARSAPLPEGIWRTTSGLVSSITVDSVERITVAYHIVFDAAELPGKPCEIRDLAEPCRVGERIDRVVYTRRSNGLFEMDEALSTATQKEVEDFYEDFDRDNFDPEEFLKFNFQGLTGIARGSDGKSWGWLRRFLDTAGDSRESRALKHVLASH